MCTTYFWAKKLCHIVEELWLTSGGDFHLWFCISSLFVMPIFRTLGWFLTSSPYKKSSRNTLFYFLGVYKFYMSRSCKSFRLNIQHMVWKSRRSTLYTFPYAKLQHQPKAIDTLGPHIVLSTICALAQETQKLVTPTFNTLVWKLKRFDMICKCRIFDCWETQENYKGKDYIE